MIGRGSGSVHALSRDSEAVVCRPRSTRGLDSTRPSTDSRRHPRRGRPRPMETDPNVREVMLITGASRGIGAASAVLAAERGYDVAISYRSDAGAAEAIAERARAHGARAATIRADVASEDDVERMFATVDVELGTLAVLVNNAGTLDLQMRLDEMTPERVERTLRVNVLGVFLCCRAAVHRMSTRYGGAGGRIVNVSSVAARIGGAREYIDYAASKGAVDTMTVGLANEGGGGRHPRERGPAGHHLHRSARAGRRAGAGRPSEGGCPDEARRRPGRGRPRDPVARVGGVLVLHRLVRRRVGRALNGAGHGGPRRIAPRDRAPRRRGNPLGLRKRLRRARQGRRLAGHGGRYAGGARHPGGPRAMRAGHPGGGGGVVRGRPRPRRRRPAVLPRRPARRHPGVHRPQRRVHGEHRARRGRRAHHRSGPPPRPRRDLLDGR